MGEYRRHNTGKRAAIKWTISAIKRGRGAAKLAVRGQVKSALVMDLKYIAHNFRRLKSWFQIKAEGGQYAKFQVPLQGVSVPMSLFDGKTRRSG